MADLGFPFDRNRANLGEAVFQFNYDGSNLIVEGRDIACTYRQECAQLQTNQTIIGLGTGRFMTMAQRTRSIQFQK